MPEHTELLIASRRPASGPAAAMSVVRVLRAQMSWGWQAELCDSPMHFAQPDNHLSAGHLRYC